MGKSLGFRVTVTDDDIAAGRYGGSMYNPIALAIGKVTNTPVICTPKHVLIMSYDQLRLAENYVLPNWKIHELPQKAIDFQEEWSRNSDITLHDVPFTFYVGEEIKIV